MRHFVRPKEDDGMPGPVLVKYVVISILALGCGFLSFNMQELMKLTHIHVSLSHSHKMQSFCAFIGCKLTEDMQEMPGVKHEQAKAADTKQDTQLADTIKALSSRVCGSPAVDGYTHVVPKCLEDSPTNKWFQEYYAKGGKQSDLVAHIEEAADYDGLAVVWGIKNTKKTAEECAEHCKRHMPKQVAESIPNAGPFSELPCNAFAFCPDEVCFEPDAHHHTKGDCWLKFTEGPVSPEINMRGDLPPDYRARHPTAPKRVQWISGVLLPPGVKPTNGTWGPRWKW